MVCILGSCSLFWILDMGSVLYIYYLSDEDYIVVRFYSKGKQVERFVVNYVVSV